MRQGQHKNRSRGRGNQRRPGGGNPSNRVYESNGPDVKVRGTAQTVADKYLQLARDAVSTGDIVMSESYFQHAEHYNRIIAANQSQQQQQRAQEASANDGGKQSENAPGTGPQPVESKSEDKPSGNDKADARGNGAETGDVASFDGDLPQFLQKPAEDSEPAEKPKRQRRPSSRSKTAKQSDGDETEASADKASAENQDDPASDAEVVAG
ncbi:MAG: DUF4167 domain-containing protein [Rhizobiales bacterium]|nr:DUF4167 domain-containing protein [Hyphomicrobiales bacterium]